MNSNQRFGAVGAQLDSARSVFNRDSTHKTSFNVGDLIPIYVDEVLPGDTFDLSLNQVVRSSTPIFPTMDNAVVDTYAFFVPNRIVFDRWKEVMGENTRTDGIPQDTPSVPVLTGSSNDLADYMGIPPISITSVESGINALPFRAYTLIWNEWFRDQNLQRPVVIDKSATNQQFSSFQLLKANKKHDYFTSALPYPQKGANVSLPLGVSAPVITQGASHDSKFSLAWKAVNGASGTGYPFVEGAGGYTSIAPGAPPGRIGAVYPSNLVADLSNATASTINNLRLAFTTQQMLEIDARSGTRYTEFINAHFGVLSEDARQQRPEYLGGTSTPLNMSQVPQTSQSTATSPQGNLSAFSHTFSGDHLFKKSFTEHGFVIIVAVVRTEKTYQNGVERFWFRRSKLDYYVPVFANIGEQAILNREIVFQGSGSAGSDNGVFGYQEAWADYRYKPNRLSKDMRSTSARRLDSWHYAENFGRIAPVLNSAFIQEPKEPFDRTLAVSSAIADQLIADFRFFARVARPLPTYSIPGLRRM